MGTSADRGVASSISFSSLWEANKNRRWIRVLLAKYRSGEKGKDVDTIFYWMQQYINGVISLPLFLSSRRSLEVGDGNHRLVALFLIGFNGPIPVEFPS